MPVRSTLPANLAVHTHPSQAPVYGRLHAVSRLRQSVGIVRIALLGMAFGTGFSINENVFAADRPALNTTAAQRYDKPAGPLGRALSSVAVNAGLALSFDPALTEGKTSPALAGRYIPQEAIAHLLTGSNLELIARTDGSYTLDKTAAIAAARQDSAEQTLPIVTVAGSNVRDTTTEGTGSYATRATTAATGLPLSLRDTPQSVTVVTRQQIEDQDLQSLSEVLRNVTGVFVTSSDSDRNDFYARGFYIDNLQYDGVPTSLGLSFYGESGNDSTIYDRIEVVRGATGLTTGAGNPSASINLVRKHADSKVFTGNISAGVGSQDHYRATLDLSTPLTEDGRIRGRIVSTIDEHNSQVDLYHDRKQVFYGVIDADLTPNTKLSIGADYQANRPTASTWGGLPLVFSNGQPTNWNTSKTTAADWTHWSSTNRTFFASLEQRLDNGWKIKTNLSHRESDYNAKLLYLYGQPDIITGTGLRALPNYSEYFFKQNNIDVQANGPFALLGRQHELIVGLSANRSHEVKASHTRSGTLDSTGNFYNWDGSFAEPNWGPLALSGDEKIRQLGLYSAARLSLTDSVKLIVGGRQNSWKSDGLTESRSHNVFTPYAGLIVDINKTYSAYASYTDVFQPQDYRNRNGAYLDPVTGKNYEAGIKGEHFGGKLNTSFSFFRIAQNNVAQRDGDYVVPGTSDSAYYGAKGVVSRGFEAQVSGELATGWNASLGVSRVISRDATNTLINTTFPATLVTLFSTYRLSGDWSGLTVGGGVNWQNRNFTTFSTNAGDFEYAQKAFGIVNLMARYAFTPKLSLQVNVNNLFDKKYYTNIDGQGQFGTIRNLMSTLNYRF